MTRERWLYLALILALGSARMFLGHSPLDFASGFFAGMAILAAFEGRSARQ